MRLAVDVMGGDRAPEAVLEGCCAVEPLLGEDDKLLLVGDEAVIAPALGRLGDRCEMVKASQVVEMHESPVTAIRSKPDSSIAVMCKLVASGEADAALSAGNTGACVAAAQLRMRTLKGVSRPGIAVAFPTLKGPVVLCDAGANPEPRPLHLQQYAIMAGVYAEVACGHVSPTVGLLSIGEEASKGNAIVKETRKLLAETKNIDFVGNVEGRDILTGDCRVIVCDGFVGNTILKFAEGFQLMIRQAVTDVLAKSGAGGSEGQGGELLKQLFAKLDWQEFGGAPLLGVGGYMTICHGASGPRAITNAIKAAQKQVASNVNDMIVSRIAGNHAEAPVPVTGAAAAV